VKPREPGSVKARIHITLKPGVLDPQGKAIANTLDQMGFGGIGGVRQGKYLELELEETDTDAARSQVDAMCAKLLANTVIENYTIELAD
jgi:phosphoribosylformylglycinamidine synthase